MILDYMLGSKKIPKEIKVNVLNAKINNNEVDYDDVFLVELLSYDGNLISVIPNPSDELKRAAVQENGESIQFIDEQTPEICEMAFKNTIGSLEHIIDVDSLPIWMKYKAIIEEPIYISYFNEQTEEMKMLASINSKNILIKNTIDYPTLDDRIINAIVYEGDDKNKALLSESNKDSFDEIIIKSILDKHEDIRHNIQTKPLKFSDEEILINERIEKALKNAEVLMGRVAKDLVGVELKIKKLDTRNNTIIKSFKSDTDYVVQDAIADIKEIDKFIRYNFRCNKFVKPKFI